MNWYQGVHEGVNEFKSGRDSPLLALPQGGDYKRSISIHSHPPLQSTAGTNSSVTGHQLGTKAGTGSGTHSKIHFASGEYHGQPSLVPPPRLSPINNLFVASERRGDGFGNSTGLTRENLRQGLHKKYRSLQIVEVWEMSCRKPAHVNNHSGQIVEGHRQSNGFR